MAAPPAQADSGHLDREEMKQALKEALKESLPSEIASLREDILATLKEGLKGVNKGGWVPAGMGMEAQPEDGKVKVKKGIKPHRLREEMRNMEEEDKYGVLDKSEHWGNRAGASSTSLAAEDDISDDEEAKENMAHNLRAQAGSTGDMHEAPSLPGGVEEVIKTTRAGTQERGPSETDSSPGSRTTSGTPSQGNPDRKRSARAKQASAADKAMAMGPNTGATEYDEVGGLRRAAEKLIRNVRFELLVSSMILISAVHIGWQTNHMAQYQLPPEEVPMSFRVFELGFLVFFVVELSLRIFVYRRRFFKMWGWGWNVFDTFLVVSQCSEELVLLLAGDVESLQNLSSSFLLRIIRILRSIRTIRVLHVTRFAQELRLLVTCVLYSMKAFAWSLALIILVLYIVAILLCQLVLTYRVERAGLVLPEYGRQMSHWYGSVPRALMSLFEGLTGGLDWDVIVQPLISEISPWLGVFFFLYTAFVIIAVMNVVTATFVENALERSSQVKESNRMSHASRLFKALDGDNSGFISLEEILEAIDKPEVMEFFRSIDVDVSEAQMLFELLDNDGSGSIDFEEFLSGCMRLQGPARSIDLVLFVHEIKRKQMAPFYQPPASAEPRAASY